MKLLATQGTLIKGSRSVFPARKKTGQEAANARAEKELEVATAVTHCLARPETPVSEEATEKIGAKITEGIIFLYFFSLN